MTPVVTASDNTTRPSFCQILMFFRSVSMVFAPYERARRSLRRTARISDRLRRPVRPCGEPRLELNVFLPDHWQDRRLADRVTCSGGRAGPGDRRLALPAS